VHEDVDDVLRNLVSVYSNDTASDEMRRLHQSGLNFMHANTASMMCLSKFKAIGEPLIIALMGIVIFRCSHLVNTKRMETGTFVSIFMIMTTIINTLMFLVAVIKDTTLDIGTIVDTQKLFSKSANVSSAAPSLQHRTAPPFRDGVGFYNASFMHLGSKQPILQNLSIHFEHGERTIVTGDIGSGKSTMLKLMMAFVTPSEGDLYMSGVWYADMTPRDLRRSIAYMPQEAILFDRSIVENILYGAAKGITVSHVSDLISRLGVWKEFDNMTDGLDTQVGKNGSRLSGGQRQLVWFMCIVMRNPAFVVLDEPTASMDTSTKRVLINALCIFSAGRTIIMVTHDKDLMSLATRHVAWS
jgi:ABC-type bacteriocin/lantibiotic exporter with double-glycine peptidase domain